MTHNHLNISTILDIPALKQDEKLFRELIGNTPNGFGKAFAPKGLSEGDSWTFFRSSEGFYLLQRKSTSEVLDIVGYAKEIGLSIQDLKARFSQYGIPETRSNASEENLTSWLSEHGITEDEAHSAGWVLSEKEIRFPVQTDEGIKYQCRRLGVAHNQRFCCDKGLKTGEYFYSVSTLKKAGTLVVCAGASDCLNAHIALEGKHDCIGVLGESTIPSDLLALKEDYERFIIAYDNDKPGQKGIIKLSTQLGVDKCFALDWSLFPDINDLSELAGKHNRQAIKKLIEGCKVVDKADGLDKWSDSPEDCSHLSQGGNFQWEVPLPLVDGLLPVEPFNAELYLPPSLRDYVSDIAERMQCPVDFPALALIVVLSSAIGKRMGICPKAHDDWLVIPNLWGFIVGRPSLMKTPAVKESIDLLKPFQDAAFSEHGEKMKIFRAENRTLLNEQKATEQKIKELSKKAPKDEKRIKELSEIFKLELEEPQCVRYIVNDTSVEKLGEILVHNPAGVLLYRDELNGFLKSLEKENQETSRTFYLEAWNGNSSYIVDRIGRGTIEIPNICVSLFGTIQPDVLQNIVQRNISQTSEFDGFLQRFQLIAYPDIPESWENIDRKPNQEARKRMISLVGRLLNLSDRGREIHSSRGTPYFRFKKEAQELFNEWRKELELRFREKKDIPSMESHLAKYKSLVPSLALIFHLSEIENHGINEVGETSLMIALAFSEYLESQTRRIYALRENVNTNNACNLLKKIKDKEIGGSFTLRDVYRKNWKGLNKADIAQKAINELIDRNYLRADLKENSQTTIYLVNPKTFEEGDNG